MSAIEVAVSLTYRSFGIGLAADKGKYFWATLVKSFHDIHDNSSVKRRPRP